MPARLCDLKRRDLLRIVPAGALAAMLSGAVEDDTVLDQPTILQAPDDRARWPSWRKWLDEWCQQASAKLNYSDALYRREEFSWVPTSFSCCFLMMCDEEFYDHVAGRYTLGAFLENAQREFGGYDSLVLWHAYPRIGLDARNQFDFY